jgi:ATP-dependent DNA helicase DinG
MIMEKIFGPEGLLAVSLPDYERRPGQQTMALAVAQALAPETIAAPTLSSFPQSANILVVEAETGIGKTLAYLIPAVLSGRKVIISTATLTLQDQILNKEIPFIQQHFDSDLTALCVKGRQNYLCLHRYRQFIDESRQQIFDAPPEIELLQSWLEKTDTGDRAELDWLPDNSSLWRRISAAANQCLGSHCPEETSCFISRMRKKAAASRLLIVNHHLFFSDLALRITGFGEVLPRYETVIFDEAHHLETIATNFFGSSFSHYQVLDLVNDVEKMTKTVSQTRQKEKIGLAARLLVAHTERFAALFPDVRGKFPLAEFIASLPQWEDEVQILTDCLHRLQDHLIVFCQTDDIWHGMVRRCEELLDNLQRVTHGIMPEGENAAPDNAVRWYERRDKSITLHASPIEIAGVLQEILYTRIQSCIFTSATLTVGGEFTYFLERLGLPSSTPTLCLTSPFDYANRTLLYVPPKTFPQPGTENSLEKVQQKIYDILLVSKGRGLVLFTSISAMQHVYAFLADRFPYPVLIQGEAPRSLLLRKFHKLPASVLLAVASFWEGVNIPGESLSCVIIDKLPFEVPNDPIIVARLDRIRQEGGNPFLDFQVPRAILTLRQGVGRLMRAATDSGLLAILDVRLFTKSYGRIFLKSLPPSPITRDFNDLQDFFHKVTSGAI